MFLISLSLSAEQFNGKIFKNKNCQMVLKNNKELICYSLEDKGPLFVEYTLKGEVKKFKRPGFKQDGRVSYALQSNNKIYTKSGYDRGHLKSHKSSSYTKKDVEDCFKFTNILPQRPYFNRQVWRKTEIIERGLAKKFTVEVLVGVIFSKDKFKNVVSLPKYWYKVIHIKDTDKYLCFLFPSDYNYTSVYEMYLYTIEYNKLIKLIDYSYKYDNIPFKIKGVK